jgi:hypothetical protein
MGVASKNAEPPQDSNNHKHANKEHVRDNTSALTGWVNSVYEKAIILDTGCTRHVFRKVEDPQECNILLHGGQRLKTKLMQKVHYQMLDH